ncbi:MAG: hypothetical protein H6626_13585 [Pseudobdellovibrionaceae bacterium]|nr:hypothetical protein [Bdellovibrionales bacterium]USN47201.1 MAG: hypothetical protein H6626_13585 [Pseudobdellovibrionaceae bacterium]
MNDFFYPFLAFFLRRLVSPWLTQALWPLALVGVIFSAGCQLADNEIRGQINDTASTLPPDDPAPPPPACDATLLNAFGGGDGSSGEPFRVCSLNHWAHFAATNSSWDKFIRLESDLDFTSIDYANFHKIGTGGTPFTGHFDGNNKKIRNIAVDAGSDNVAVFMETGSNATFQNIFLENIHLTSTGGISTLIRTHKSGGTLTLNNVHLSAATFSTKGSGIIHESLGPVDISNVSVTDVSIPIGSLTGGVIGFLGNSGTFTNIDVINLSRTNIVDIFSNMGGVVGAAGGVATFNFQFTNINVTGLSIVGSANSGVGGILGRFSSSYMASVNINQAQVSGAINGMMVGGLVGEADVDTINITDSSFNGTLDGGSGTCGGLVGSIYANSGLVTQSFATGSATVWSGIGGGLIGGTSISGGLTLSNSYSSSSVNSTHASSGVVGGLVGSGGGTGTIDVINSYFAGTATGNNRLGCVAGVASATLTLSDVYYDSSTCDKNTVDSAPYAGGTGQPTANMQTATPFPNWNTGVWNFLSGSYPQL